MLISTPSPSSTHSQELKEFRKLHMLILGNLPDVKENWIHKVEATQEDQEKDGNQDALLQIALRVCSTSRA